MLVNHPPRFIQFLRYLGYRTPLSCSDLFQKFPFAARKPETELGQLYDLAIGSQVVAYYLVYHPFSSITAVYDPLGQQLPSAADIHDHTVTDMVFTLNDFHGISGHDEKVGFVSLNDRDWS